MGSDGRRDRPGTKRRAAEDRLVDLPVDFTWSWSDSSATGVLQDGGGGFLTTYIPSGDTREVRGYLCSSTRAKLNTLRTALEKLSNIEDRDTSHPVIVCTDSMAALTLLENDPASQRAPV